MATTFSVSSLRHCYKQLWEGSVFSLACVRFNATLLLPCLSQYNNFSIFPFQGCSNSTISNATFNLINLVSKLLICFLLCFPDLFTLLCSFHSPPSLSVSLGTISSSVKNSTHSFQTTTENYYYTHSYCITISLDGSSSNNIQRPKGFLRSQATCFKYLCSLK